MTLRFRDKGTSSWREGLPLLRIQRDVYESPNMFAGRIFGLEPATTYECQFTMADPDGFIGVAEKSVVVTTRSVPKPSENGNVYHVYQLEQLDFRLRAGSAAVDAGCELPTLTDGFIGTAPDLTDAVKNISPNASGARPSTERDMVRMPLDLPCSIV